MLHYSAERNYCPILVNISPEEILASFPALLETMCVDTEKQLIPQLPWRPVLTELSTYCKSRLCIRHGEDRGQSHISECTRKKEVIWKLP